MSQQLQLIRLRLSGAVEVSREAEDVDCATMLALAGIFTASVSYAGTHEQYRPFLIEDELFLRIAVSRRRPPHVVTERHKDRCPIIRGVIGEHPEHLQCRGKRGQLLRHVVECAAQIKEIRLRRLHPRAR